MSLISFQLVGNGDKCLLKKNTSLRIISMAYLQSVWKIMKTIKLWMRYPLSWWRKASSYSVIDVTYTVAWIAEEVKPILLWYGKYQQFTPVYSGKWKDRARYKLLKYFNWFLLSSHLSTASYESS